MSHSRLVQNLLRSFIAALLLLPSAAFGSAHARIDSLNAVDRPYIFSNISESIALYRSVADEAHELGYEAGEAEALTIFALAIYMKGNYDESVEAHLRATRIYERLDMREELAMALGDFGHQMKRRDLEKEMHGEPDSAAKSLQLLRDPSRAENTEESADFSLTPRETEVLEQLSRGLEYRDIASNLFISPATVRKHIENIYRKLQVDNKMKAVRKASRHGLI